MTYIVPIKSTKSVDYNGSTYEVSYFNNLLSTNAVDEAQIDWDSVTNFAKDSYVKVTGLNRVYRLAADESAGQYPPANPSVWIDYGAINSYRLFDDIIGSQTEFDTTMTVTIDANKMNSLALLNMENIISVRVVQEDINMQITLYDKSIELLEYGVLSLYDYWWKPTKYKRDLVVQDLQYSLNSNITLEFTAAILGKVGACITGIYDNIAITLSGTRVDYKDYSKYLVDDYGNMSFSKRGYAKIITAQSLIDTNSIDETCFKLAELRGSVTLFVGDESVNGHTVLTTLGYIESIGMQIDDPSKTQFPIKIIGVK